MCVTDGCLSHKTAVAAGALSQYLRFMLDPGPPEFKDITIFRESLFPAHLNNSIKNNTKLQVKLADHVQQKEKIPNTNQLLNRNKVNENDLGNKMNQGDHINQHDSNNGEDYDEKKEGEDQEETYPNYDENVEKQGKDNNDDIYQGGAAKNDQKQDEEENEDVDDNQYKEDNEKNNQYENAEDEDGDNKDENGQYGDDDDNGEDVLNHPKFPILNGRLRVGHEAEKNKKAKQKDQSDGYHYYDDKLKDSVQNPPLPGVKVHSDVKKDQTPHKNKQSPGLVYIVVSLVSLVLVFLLAFRFIRQRRISIRYTLFNQRV